jgi:hypothetical protein
MNVIQQIVKSDEEVISFAIIWCGETIDKCTSFIKNHLVEEGFDHHGLNEEQGYWWGRNDEEINQYRFFIEQNI